MGRLNVEGCSVGEPRLSKERCARRPVDAYRLAEKRNRCRLGTDGSARSRGIDHRRKDARIACRRARGRTHPFNHIANAIARAIIDDARIGGVVGQFLQRKWNAARVFLRLSARVVALRLVVARLVRYQTALEQRSDRVLDGCVSESVPKFGFRRTGFAGKNSRPLTICGMTVSR